MILAAEFGTGEVFLSILWFFLFVLWIYLVVTIFVDIMRADEMSGWAKALWAIFIIILPIIGVLVYLIANGNNMTKRRAADQQAQDDVTRAYIRAAASESASAADELDKLADLHRNGSITDQEYAAAKKSVLGT